MRISACAFFVLAICQANVFSQRHEQNVEPDKVFGAKDCDDCKGFLNDVSQRILSTENEQKLINKYTEYACSLISNAAVYRYCSLVVESIAVKLMKNFADDFASEDTCIVLTFCPPSSPQLEY